MSWMRIVLGGLAAGIVINIADFVMHGLIMGPVYTKYPEVFEQTQANPLLFVLVAVFIGLAAALLFGKSRASWAPGWKGGATFGFFLGLVGFWPHFYSSIVIDGFPYHLSWCWGGITLIDSVLGGAVLGLIVKRP